MHVLSRSPRRVFALAALSLSFALARPVLANDPKVEGDAKKLQQDAMDIDFLGLDLKKAKDKLQKAIKKCGSSKCSKPVLATLHRDLGIVLLNAGDQANGEKEIAAAFANDPNVTIGKDYLDNGAVKKAWESAKKAKGGGGDDGGGGGDKVTPPPLAEGALGVTVNMAPIGYELPIVISIPSGLDVASVKVSYKTDTIEKYRQLEAKKSSGKWIAILPCEVTAKPTTIKFFVKAYDESSSELEHYGNIKKPGVIKVVDSMPDEVEAPQLPGGKDPKECAEGGGEGGPAGKPEGAGCSDDDECDKGLVCVENDTGKKWCKPGEKKPKSDVPKLWVGVDGEIDLVFLGQDTDLCKQTGVWACTVDGADGNRYDLTTSSGDSKIRVGPTGGKTDGGMAIATKRVFLSLDYFTTPSLSIGARLGYVFGGNPTTSDPFIPVHAEGRLQYFITEGTFRPYFLFAGGFGQYDAPVPNVIVQPQDPNQANACKDGGDLAACADADKILKGVTAYKRVGPGFVGAGLGVWLHPTPKIAINLAVKGLFPIPTMSFVVAPELGMKFAF